MGYSVPKKGKPRQVWLSPDAFARRQAKVLEKMAVWTKENRDKTAGYYQKFKDQRLIEKKEYYQKNKERIRARCLHYYHSVYKHRKAKSIKQPKP
jgi:hypothetical protein